MIERYDSVTNLQALTDKLSNMGIEDGDFVLVKTEYADLSPIYLFTLTNSSHNGFLKGEQNGMNTKKEIVLKFGSQLYLKSKINKNNDCTLKIVSSPKISKGNTIFFELTLDGKFLAKQRKEELKFLEMNTNECIWALFQKPKGRTPDLQMQGRQDYQ